MGNIQEAIYRTMFSSRMGIRDRGAHLQDQRMGNHAKGVLTYRRCYDARSVIMMCPSFSDNIRCPRATQGAASSPTMGEGGPLFCFFSFVGLVLACGPSDESASRTLFLLGMQPIVGTCDEPKWVKPRCAQAWSGETHRKERKPGRQREEKGMGLLTYRRCY